MTILPFVLHRTFVNQILKKIEPKPRYTIFNQNPNIRTIDLTKAKEQYQDGDPDL